VKITEVRIFPKEGADKKLRAFATITFDNCFVVRDIKIIEGNRGLFVAMPSRRIKESCPKCGHRNVIRASYCNQCGARLPQSSSQAMRTGDPQLLQAEHKDVAHPITVECREYIQNVILETYQREREKLQTVQAEGQQNQ